MAVALLASPVAEYCLIRYVSGVPILEVRLFFFLSLLMGRWNERLMGWCLFGNLKASGDKKFKGNAKWEEYKK